MRLRLLFFCSWLALVHTPFVPAQSPTSTQVIAWARQMRPVWENLYSESRRKGARPVPVPPEVDPPCKQCGDSNKTQGELDVDAWATTAMKPESDQVAQILQITKQAMLYRQTPGINDAALSALGYLPNDESGLAAARELMGRYMGYRALEMSRQYRTQPKRAYAGITLLLRAAKEYAMLGGPDATEQQALDDARWWVSEVYSKLDEDILKGKRYDLCPSYLEILRDLELLGQNDSYQASDAKIEDYKKMIDKMDKLLHFTVKLNMKADTSGTNGSHIHNAWSGTAKLRIKLDLGSACYTTEVESPLATDVDNWDFVGDDGTPVELVSSRRFITPIKPPTLNLCDPNPVLLIPFDFLNIPKETISAKGHQAPGAFFSGFLTATISANNVNDASQYTGRSNGGPATAGMNNTITAQDDPIAQLKAHQGDTGWMMSPQGQAAIKQLQQKNAAVMNQYRGRIAAQNNAAGDASSPASAVSAFQSAQLHWKNGSTTVASDVWHVTKDSTNLQLEIKVTNTPQQ